MRFLSLASKSEFKTPSNYKDFWETLKKVELDHPFVFDELFWHRMGLWKPVEKKSPDLQSEESPTPSAELDPEESPTPSAELDIEEPTTPSAELDPEESPTPSAELDIEEPTTPSAELDIEESPTPSAELDPEELVDESTKPIDSVEGPTTTKPKVWAWTSTNEPIESKPWTRLWDKAVGPKFQPITRHTDLDLRRGPGGRLSGYFPPLGESSDDQPFDREFKDVPVRRPKLSPCWSGGFLGRMSSYRLYRDPAKYNVPLHPYMDQKDLVLFRKSEGPDVYLYGNVRQTPISERAEETAVSDHESLEKLSPDEDESLEIPSSSEDESLETPSSSEDESLETSSSGEDENLEPPSSGEILGLEDTDCDATSLKSEDL